jgi:hypothetical protein
MAPEVFEVSYLCALLDESNDVTGFFLYHLFLITYISCLFFIFQVDAIFFRGKSLPVFVTMKKIMLTKGTGTFRSNFGGFFIFILEPLWQK